MMLKHIYLNKFIFKINFVMMTLIIT